MSSSLLFQAFDPSRVTVQQLQDDTGKFNHFVALFIGWPRSFMNRPVCQCSDGMHPLAHRLGEITSTYQSLNLAAGALALKFRQLLDGSQFQNGPTLCYRVARRSNDVKQVFFKVVSQLLRKSLWRVHQDIRVKPVDAKKVSQVDTVTRAIKYIAVPSRSRRSFAFYIQSLNSIQEICAVTRQRVLLPRRPIVRLAIHRESHRKGAFAFIALEQTDKTLGVFFPLLFTALVCARLHLRCCSYQRTGPHRSTGIANGITESMEVRHG